MYVFLSFLRSPYTIENIFCSVVSEFFIRVICITNNFSFNIDLTRTECNPYPGLHVYHINEAQYLYQHSQFRAETAYEHYLELTCISAILRYVFK